MKVRATSSVRIGSTSATVTACPVSASSEVTVTPSNPHKVNVSKVDRILNAF